MPKLQQIGLVMCLTLSLLWYWFQAVRTPDLPSSSGPLNPLEVYKY